MCSSLGVVWPKISTIYFGKFKHFYSLPIISFFDSNFDHISGLNLSVVLTRIFTIKCSQFYNLHIHSKNYVYILCKCNVRFDFLQGVWLPQPSKIFGSSLDISFNTSYTSICFKHISNVVSNVYNWTGPFYFGTGTNFPTLRTVDQAFSTGFTTVILFKKLNFLEKTR